jgi:hypothetical protein
MCSAHDSDGARVGVHDFGAIIGKITIPSFVRSVDDVHGDFFRSQGSRVRDCNSEFAFNVRDNVDRSVFEVLTRLFEDMVGDILCIPLFVFRFVQPVASVVAFEGSNLPEVGLLDACGIQTPRTIAGLACDGIILLVGSNREQLKVVTYRDFIARLLEHFF